MMKRSIAVALALLLAPVGAAAHLGGVPTIAWFTAPMGVGHVVDESITFTWYDYDDLADTVGLTTIDFFWATEMPPTYRLGGQPFGLESTAIVKNIPEEDLANSYEWDVSELPSGSYFLVSLAHDPPFEMYAFSKGVVTVAHAGDPVHPAVIVTEPDGDRDVARGTYEIRWEAFDPDATGTVRLEATRAVDGTDRLLLAEGLDPAAGSFVWETTGLEKGDWMVRAMIEDERGLSHAAWGTFFVRVADPYPGSGGSGGSAGAGGSGGAGGEDGTGGIGGGEAGAGGEIPVGTGGTGGGRKGGGGGGCATAPGALGGAALLLPLAWSLRRRRA